MGALKKIKKSIKRIAKNPAKAVKNIIKDTAIKPAKSVLKAARGDLKGAAREVGLTKDNWKNIQRELRTWGAPVASLGLGVAAPYLLPTLLPTLGTVGLGGITAGQLGTGLGALGGAGVAALGGANRRGISLGALMGAGAGYAGAGIGRWAQGLGQGTAAAGGGAGGGAGAGVDSVALGAEGPSLLPVQASGQVAPVGANLLPVQASGAGGYVTAPVQGSLASKTLGGATKLGGAAMAAKGLMGGGGTFALDDGGGLPAVEPGQGIDPALLDYLSKLRRMGFGNSGWWDRLGPGPYTAPGLNSAGVF